MSADETVHLTAGGRERLQEELRDLVENRRPVIVKRVATAREEGDLTGQVAEKLQENGFADVRTLTGGFAAWEEAGGETQEPSLEQVVPPMRASEVQQLDRRI